MNQERPHLQIVPNELPHDTTEIQGPWRQLSGIGALTLDQLNETGTLRGANARSVSEDLDTMYGHDGWTHDTDALSDVNNGTYAPLGLVLVSPGAEINYNERRAAAKDAGKLLPLTFEERANAKFAYDTEEQAAAARANMEPVAEDDPRDRQRRLRKLVKRENGRH